jgi:hypothetical protein
MSRAIRIVVKKNAISSEYPIQFLQVQYLYQLVSGKICLEELPDRINTNGIGFPLKTEVARKAQARLKRLCDFSPVFGEVKLEAADI